MFVTRKIWAITVPCIVLFCFSNPVRGEADSVSWENLSEHLAQESIPLLQLNVSNCPNKIENLEPSRVVAQIIENTFCLWEEYDILTADGNETVCIVMKKPNPGPLSKVESQILLTASSLWRESKPRPQEAIILDASDPRLNLPPIEDFLGNEEESIKPENVIGDDDRRRITDTTSYPWRTHCYLELYFQDAVPAFSARGTGCIVSPYMVLTCGHNVYHQDDDNPFPTPSWVTSVTIAPGQDQDYEGGQVTRPYGTREGVEFQTNSGYIAGGSWEDDYGAVFFCRPFSGISTYMPLEWSRPSVGETVYLAGYPEKVHLGTPSAETNSQALWHDSDPVISNISDILYYTIDTSRGQSGAPVLKKNFVMDPGRIVAVHAFGSSTGNGGPRLRSDNRTLITEWMQHIPYCPPPCEECEPEDEYLGTIGTFVWGYNVSGNCGNGGKGKWVGQFVGEAGATYHFDLCPDSPGSGIANFDADIKITNGSCSILHGEDGSCNSPEYLPNNFEWNCISSGTYYVIIAPFSSYNSHTCEGDASDTFTLEYYSVKDEPDAYEPDNTAVEANEILPDSPQTHSIAPVGDVDYVRFSLDSESEVVIETSGLSDDTEMWLYDEQENEIDYNDDGGTGRFSRIERTTSGIDALSAGTYYVKVAEYGNNAKIDSYEIILTVTPCAGPCCPTTISSYPYTESFESDFGDWYEYHSTDVPKSIPDLGTTTSTLHVADSGTIVDLNVKLNITHTFDSDLDVYLIAPDGTRVELFTDVGSSGDNFTNTTLDDEALLPITDESASAPYTGSYKPEGSLSDLDRMSITGTWKLEITDDYDGDYGTLNSWSLMVETGGGSGDWVNATDDDIDWTRHSGSTPSTGTGPSSAHDGMYYLYTEATGSGYPNKQAILEGPCFDLSSLSNPELRFWYHMYGATMGTLTVEVSDNNCASWTPVWSLSGDQGDSWYEAVIDLFAYSGSTIKVRFVAVTGSSYTSDMAIDYVTVAEGELDPPVLQPEPNITPGLRNTIYWDPVADANRYYAQCANDANFANIVTGSRWITDTNYTFANLDLGQVYWYRLKAASGIERWSQTSQAEFQTDMLTDTNATSAGDVILAAGGIPTTDTLGNADSSGTYSQKTIFNVIECNENALLTEIEMYLGIALSQILQFVVYETPSESGGYGTHESIHSNLIASGTGTGWYSSGPILVPLVAGKSYCIGVAWSDEATFYCDFGAGFENITWGRKVSGKSISIYPAPNSTSVIAYTGTSYYQNLITSAYSSSGSIVSAAIDLPSEGDWDWDIVRFNTTTPAGTELTVDILPSAGSTPIPGYENLSSGADPSGISHTSIRLRANLLTNDPNNTPVLHDWSVSYAGPCISNWSNVESSLQCDTLCDFDNNERVNFADFAILANQWLQSQGTSCVDIAPLPEGDGIVNFLDFAVLAIHWLAGTDPAIECFPSSRSDYAQWVAVGRPDCWCCETQCHGDSNCDGVVDDKDRSPIQPLIGARYPDISYDPCFDFDHDGNIDYADLGIVTSWYEDRPPGNCLQP